MDFTLSPKVEELRRRVIAFMEAHVYPAEKTHKEQVRSSDDPHKDSPILLDQKEGQGRGAMESVLAG